MAINVYCGLQGSGKSFEVVSSVILEAILNGRRVVTNVAGIDQSKIHEYLIKKKAVDPSKLGVIVHVANDRISQPQFFPDEEKPDEDSIVKGGDLVAIDEAWRFWGTDNGKLSHEHMQFFRMHRHYVHAETAISCDVALMTQDITGLHRSVKNVVELTFRMQKHKSLGFSKRYRVDIYEGWKINSRTRISNHQKAYDAKIFPLYQSYVGGKGLESSIDKRQNIFGNLTLWVFLVVGLIFGFGTLFYVWRFFHPSTVQKSASSTSRPSWSASSSGQARPSQQSKPMASEVWRITGTIHMGSERWVVIADANGRLRLESPSLFRGSHETMIGDVDGDKVSTWSGALPRSQAASPDGLSK
jgi:zona occludens toxin